MTHLNFCVHCQTCTYHAWVNIVLILCCSNCGPWTSSITVPWELVRNAESQAWPQTFWLRIYILRGSSIIDILWRSFILFFFLLFFNWSEIHIDPLMFKKQWSRGSGAPVLWPLDAKNQLAGKDRGVLGKIEARRRRGRQRKRWLDGIIDSMNMNLSKLGDREGQGSLVCCSLWGCSRPQISHWTRGSIKFLPALTTNATYWYFSLLLRSKSIFPT